MTNLDIYVFKALQKAYSQGYLDGIENMRDLYGEEHNFEDVLDEVLFCTEYAELSREQLLHPAGWEHCSVARMQTDHIMRKLQIQREIRSYYRNHQSP